MNLQSQAVIVWIDDYFLSDEFKSNSAKYTWNQLFGTLSSRVYRLIDIKTKFIATANDTLNFILNTNIVNSDTYYYFIVDRNLPYDIGDVECDTASEDIINLLLEYKQNNLKVNFDFTMLSSSSSDTYSIKGIDFQNKPRNKEFQLPIELKHKILINIKNNIGLIDLSNMLHNLNFYSNINFNKDNWVTLFPFVSQYKSFVELQEIEAKSFETLIILSNQTISDNFILQSIYIVLQDIIKNYDAINYVHYEDYNKLINSNALIQLQEPNHIPIVRLDKFNNESFDKLFSNLKYRFKVIIIDENDEDINNYLNKHKKVRIVKVDGLTKNNSEISKEIVFTLLSNKLNTTLNILSDSLYNKYPQLLLHPILYNMITDFTITASELDDPAEIIQEIDNYFDSINIKEDIQYNSIEDNQPISFDTEYIYSRASDVYKESYNDFIVNTIKYWLSNSWNLHHNLAINDKLKQIWQEESFKLLNEMLIKVDIQKIQNQKDKMDFINIKESINNFTQNNNAVLTSKIQWPHEKYPMPIYMLNILHNKNGKKLYIQDKDLSFIDNSMELLNSFEILNTKIEYYRNIFNLIQQTTKYFPKKIANLFLELVDNIKDKHNISISKKKDDFKMLANIILRIVINFGLLIKNVDNDKIKYIRIANNPKNEDLAGLGLLVQDIRDHIFKYHNMFQIDEELTQFHSYINNDLHVDFLKNHSNIKNSLFSDMNNNIFNMNKGITGSIAKDINDPNIEYLYRLYRINNINQISQLSNFGEYLLLNSHKLKLNKHKNGYMLLSYLADTRNMWEHGNPNLWNEEMFQEFFIYSYEAIWSMQKFILENAYNIKNLPQTRYVKLADTIVLDDEELQNFINDFSKYDEYINYFNKLYFNGEDDDS
jgi:hypothetical protein